MPAVPGRRINNPSDLYHRAHEEAQAAVTRSPEASYALAHIINDDARWKDIFATAFLSVIPLQATLDGCAQTLKTCNTAVTKIAAIQVPAPADTAVNDTDMATARHWLATTLQRDLDHDQRQLMIVDHLLANGWETDPTRLASLMLAIVATAHATAAQGDMCAIQTT